MSRHGEVTSPDDDGILVLGQQLQEDTAQHLQHYHHQYYWPYISVEHINISMYPHISTYQQINLTSSQWKGPACVAILVTLVILLIVAVLAAADLLLVLMSSQSTAVVMVTGGCGALDCVLGRAEASHLPQLGDTIQGSHSHTLGTHL